MTNTLSSRITLAIVESLTGATPSNPLTSTLGPSFGMSYNVAHVLATGTGVGLADLLWPSTRSLAASATENIDLTSLTDPFGLALTFAKVKALIVVAAGENTNSVVVGNAASNGWFAPFDAVTDTITLPPNGVLHLEAPTSGWVVDSTHKVIKVANSSSGTGVTYDIILIGTSA